MTRSAHARMLVSVAADEDGAVEGGGRLHHFQAAGEHCKTRAEVIQGDPSG